MVSLVMEAGKMKMRIDPTHPEVKEKQQRAKQLPVYDTKEAATKAAVQQQQADQDALIEVWKAPDGMFVVAPHQVWEDLYQLGYDRSVDNNMIYDIAAGCVDEMEETTKE